MRHCTISIPGEKLTSGPLIFCDFDGTIACKDVGYRMFHHFSGGRNEELIPDWKSGRLSSREVLLMEAEMVTTTPETMNEFLDSMELDKGFPGFVALCEANGVVPIVLSEGLDFYIEYLLKKNSLDHLPVIANHGEIKNGKLLIEFPHLNEKCDRCGSCKGERIEELLKAATSSDGQIDEDSVTRNQVIFVGDGYSDACAATQADILLAKKDLAIYCSENKISYTPYDDFDDVGESIVGLGLLSR